MKKQIESGRNLPNILVVDDVPANLKLLDDILKPEGYKIRLVPGGERALRAAENEKPDLILLDIMMPGIDGFEVCRQLKQNPTLKDIPLIFISALNDTVNIVKALHAGGVDYISKPFQAEEVLARVHTHLKLHRQSQELLQLIATKDKFFSIIAHDLRGPFSGFLGLTQIMSEQLSTLSLTELKDISVSMNKSATNLYSLINNLLEWARMQQNATNFEPKPLLLFTFATTTMLPLLEIASKKGVEVHFNIPATLNALADENMLSSIIRNLVSNAIKFTPAGGKVSISAKATADGTIEISVKDSGVGMNAEILANMFKLNSNISRIGTDGEPSTGLGLLLCKDFIEKHSGKIWVTSEENKGSVFYFTISGSSGQKQEEVLQRTIPDSKITIPVNNLKILVAEDDYASEKLISIMSRQFSSDVIKVRTGAEAVESIRNNPDIDLVLMDIKMPIMDGLEATRQIRQYNTNVVIVVQTANDSPEAREKAMQAGCNYYITKPIDKEKLINLIQNHFCNQSM